MHSLKNCGAYIWHSMLKCGRAWNSSQSPQSIVVNLWISSLHTNHVPIHTHYTRIECCVTAHTRTIQFHMVDLLSPAHPFLYVQSHCSLACIVMIYVAFIGSLKLCNLCYQISCILDLYDFQFANECCVFPIPKYRPKRVVTFFLYSRNLNMAYESKVNRPDEIQWSGQTTFTLIYPVNMYSQTIHKLNR